MSLQTKSRVQLCDRYGGQSGIRCTAREPHREQTNLRDRANAMKGVSGAARITSKAILP
ncbi:hypothetical protein [Methylocystis sp.]|uniref:hypothetical protein n=1 Tax=Methylocystis sp. TaxID=1911079 RepID=UPI0025EF0198|nr:hypothetical protein [Methylocystis sp.]